MIGIYKITSPNNRVYIGQSRNIKKRFSNYKYLYCKKQKRLYASFLKYGVENHKFDILEFCLLEDLNKKERYYQDLYSVLGKEGLNCTLTEYGCKVRVYSYETILKMSNSRKGFVPGESARKKISYFNMGNSYAKGYKHTAEALIKISNNSKGRKTSQNQKTKVRELFSKKVIDKSTGIIYNSITDCSLVFGITANSIGRYLNGKRKNKTNLIYYESTL